MSSKLDHYEDDVFCGGWLFPISTDLVGRNVSFLADSQISGTSLFTITEGRKVAPLG